jgi:hypothetical protein
MKVYCKNCKYSYKDKSDSWELTQCRRYPPTVVYDDTYMRNNVFPYVEDIYWCGEFKAKEES